MKAAPCAMQNILPHQRPPRGINGCLSPPPGLTAERPRQLIGVTMILQAAEVIKAPEVTKLLTREPEEEGGGRTKPPRGVPSRRGRETAPFGGGRGEASSQSAVEAAEVSLSPPRTCLRAPHPPTRFSLPVQVADAKSLWWARQPPSRPRPVLLFPTFLAASSG